MAQRTGSAPQNDSDARDLIVSLAEVKSQARITHDGEDDLILAFIRSATTEAEGYLGITFVTRAYRDVWDGFPTACDPGGIYIPLRWAPVPSRPTVQYIDADGDTITMAAADIVFDGYRVTPVVGPAYGTSWPSTRATPGAVTLFYEAGGDVANVDHRYRDAVRAMAAFKYRNRDLKDDGMRSPQVTYREFMARQLGPKKRLAV